MKVESKKEKLEYAITLTERITGKDLTLPVLKCVLLTAQDNTLTVRATNLDLGVEVTLPVKVEEPGTIAVPADVLRRYLSLLSDDFTVTLDTDETVLSVNTPQSDTQIKTLPHDEYPSIPHIKEETFSIKPDTLISGLRSVWYAASPSSMKPELASVYVYTENGELRFVATDSFRLAEKCIPGEGFGSFESVLIPHKNVSEVVRLLENVESDVSVGITENQIAFSSDDIYVTSRIVDGSFPDYKQIIPDELPTNVVVLKRDFLDSLKLSHIFSDKFNKVTLVIPKEDGEYFSIRTENADVGENISRVDASITGDEMEASFNYNYISDAFQSLITDSVSLELGEGKPMVIRGVSDPSFMYLVMPMNK